VEPNHTTEESLVLYKLFNTFCCRVDYDPFHATGSAKFLAFTSLPRRGTMGKNPLLQYVIANMNQPRKKIALGTG
jgi:hypothetical protein